MTRLIGILEQTEDHNGLHALISFDHGKGYPIAISDPFTPEEEDELAWYFEEHLRFPFTQQVRARAAADSISVYGEKLFKEVFQDNPDINVKYRSLLRSGPEQVQIEIVGSPKFQALHWEILKDPEFSLPLALQATIVRKNLERKVIGAALRPHPTINLLVVTARPSGRNDVGYRTISRPLVEALYQANVPVQVDILRPGTYRALENHLRETSTKRGIGCYHIVHFDMHGAVLTYEQLQKAQEASRYIFCGRYGRADIESYQGVKAFLLFEGESEESKADLVEASELAGLLVNHDIPIAILNACQSGKQIGASETSLGSRLMQAGVQHVLAMSYSATVSAAELLMRTLYQKLFDGDDLSVAIRQARTELYNNKARRAYFDQLIDLEDWLLPVVYQNQPLALKPRDFIPDERAAWFERKAEEMRYTPPDPIYGFVGRDLDILQIEKRMLMKRNILLLRGIGASMTLDERLYVRKWCVFLLPDHRSLREHGQMPPGKFMLA